MFFASPHPTGECELCAYGGADFGTPFFDFYFDSVAYLPCAREFLIMGALEVGGVWETPVQSGRCAGEDRAAFGAGLIANGNGVGEPFAGVEYVGNRFGLVT